VLAAYVSGHGFGHATRVGEVLRLVREQAPGLAIAVVSTAPEALFRAAVPGPLTYRSRQCDVGLAQRGALSIDEEGTAAAWRVFAAGYEPRVAEEAAWMRTAGVRVVLADIPPLAIEAAARAGVPSVALGNFSWDWIYRHLGQRETTLRQAAEEAARAYSRAGLLLQLPFAGDLSAFPVREALPLVARRPSVPPAEARTRLGLSAGTVLLWSFGGLGLPGFDPSVLGPLSPVQVVMSADPGPVPANVVVVSAHDLARRGLGYIDLVGAADVVVTKPGYGIVSDTIGASRRMIFTDRGDFPEYPIMVAEMPQWLPAVFASQEDVFTGQLQHALADVLALPMLPPRPCDGARRAAERLIALAHA
jgi:hypothetical protein